MPAFDYLEPTTVAEAVRMVADYGARARVLAGGTDLLIQMENARLQPETVVYLGRVPELKQITWDAQEGLTIGAMASLRAVENHPIVVERYPALARGCKEVGSVQIRNLATLAGNLCNASPSADTSPALLVYDAVVEVLTPGAETREIPVDQFWTGPGRTVLRPGDLVSAIRLPVPPEAQQSYYYKLAVRKAMDLAMVGISVTLVPHDESASDVRIALAAVAPTCFRAREAEAAVERGGIGAIEEAASLAQQAASPIDDQRASAAYRREMVRVLTRRALSQLLG
jgi:aerobic carbon-monoxide dehydrogenase medium subunit